MTARFPARYEPLRDLAAIRDEMERFFRESFGSTARELATTASGWSPTLDVEETDDRYVLHVELPGVAPDDISVSVEAGVLTVTGERRFYDEKEEEGFRRIERRFGSFHRSLRLPGKFEPEAIEASCHDGVLTVTVPKAAEAAPHRIEVRAA